jgi:multiple sugar transport system permease protein
MKPPLPYRLVRLAFVCAALLFFAFPFYWAAVRALSDPRVLRPPSWDSFYPHPLSAESLNVLSFARTSIIHSAIVAGATAIASTTLALSAGYALSRLRFGKGLLLVTLLILRILPAVALMIPVFILAVRFHLRDTLPGLVIVYTALSLPFSMWLIYLAMRAVPVEIEEAAMVDGATRLQALGLMARLALPGIVAAAIFAFVFSWSEFAIALMLTGTNAVTLPVTLSNIALDAPDPYVATLALAGAVPGLVLALLVWRSLKSGNLFGATIR